MPESSAFSNYYQSLSSDIDYIEPLLHSLMASISSKRKSGRELPLIGFFLEKFSYNKLPTKMVCLKRMMFINEVGIASGSASMNGAINKTRSELKDLWTYAGYQDILKDDSSIDMMLKQLHKEYTAMMKIPKDRRTT